MSMTSQPASLFPAMTSHGNPDGVSPISVQTCARILARARAILASVLVSAKPRARRTVEPQWSVIA
jgi:histidine ammonia-lyase